MHTIYLRFRKINFAAQKLNFWINDISFNTREWIYYTPLPAFKFCKHLVLCYVLANSCFYELIMVSSLTEKITFVKHTFRVYVIKKISSFSHKYALFNLVSERCSEMVSANTSETEFRVQIKKRSSDD